MTAHSLFLRTNNANRITIDSSGSVYIAGTTSFQANTNYFSGTSGTQLVSIGATNAGRFGSVGLYGGDGVTPNVLGTLQPATLTSTRTWTLPDATGTILLTTTISTIDHGVLAGLTDDDHTQYLLLAATRGTQTLVSDVVVSGQLNVNSGGTLSDLYISTDANTASDYAQLSLIQSLTTIGKLYSNSNNVYLDALVGELHLMGSSNYGLRISTTGAVSINGAAAADTLFTNNLATTYAGLGNLYGAAFSFARTAQHLGNFDCNVVMGYTVSYTSGTHGADSYNLWVNTNVNIAGSPTDAHTYRNIRSSVVTAGTVNSVVGVDINMSIAGTVTSAYGLYIADVTGATTNYAIYSAGGGSYHAGDFEIGTSKVGTLYTTYAAFANASVFAAGSYALIQRADGLETMLNAATGGTVYVRLNNVTHTYFDPTGIVLSTGLLYIPSGSGIRNDGNFYLDTSTSDSGGGWWRFGSGFGVGLNVNYNGKIGVHGVADGTYDIKFYGTATFAATTFLAADVGVGLAPSYRFHVYEAHTGTASDFTMFINSTFAPSSAPGSFQRCVQLEIEGGMGGSNLNSNVYLQSLRIAPYLTLTASAPYEAVGVISQIYIGSGGTTLTSMKAFESAVGHYGTGELTQLAHFSISPISITAGGTVVTQYGILFGALTNATNNYTIYSNSEVPMYHKGNLGIGANFVSTYKVYIESTSSTVASSGALAILRQSTLTTGNEYAASFTGYHKDTRADGDFRVVNLTHSIAIDDSTIFTGQSNALYAYQSINTNTSGSFTGTLRGMIVEGYLYGSGSVTSYKAFQAYIGKAGTSVLTNWQGYYVSNPSVSAGSITNVYGLYIENITAGATLNYAIYAAGGKTYLNGNVGIGSTPDATHELYVQSTKAGNVGFKMVDNSGNYFQIVQNNGTYTSITPENGARCYNSWGFGIEPSGSWTVYVGGATLVNSLAVNMFTPLAGAFGTALLNVDRNANGTVALHRTSADTGGPTLEFLKRRSAWSAISSGDRLGSIGWSGADGTDAQIGAQLWAEVSGSVAANTMPTDIVFATGTATPAETLRLSGAGDLYSYAFADYKSSSTITGWGSTTGYILVKKIGKTVLVEFYLTGTSNSATTSFTLPHASYNQSGGVGVLSVYRAVDNGATAVAAACRVDNNSSTVTLFSDMQGSGWTASGTKTVWGSFHYQAA